MLNCTQLAKTLFFMRDLSKFNVLSDLFKASIITFVFILVLSLIKFFFLVHLYLFTEEDENQRFTDCASQMVVLDNMSIISTYHA